MAELDRPQMAV